MALADYLNECKEERIEVAFEAFLNRFIKMTGGPFLILPGNEVQSDVQMMFPSVCNFDSEDQFAPLYGDYFVCEEPARGRVIVEYPALVTRNGDGWLFNTSGRLRVAADEHAVKEQPQDEPGSSGGDERVFCGTCGALAKATHKFCKECGARRALVTDVNAMS